MRLKKLHINSFKNLSDVTIDFEQGNGLTMLIGNNGSGKSNVLEAISGIFHDAYKNATQRKINNPECEYSITYEIDENKLEIRRKNSTLYFFANGRLIKREVFIRSYMPQNVIAVYSGEESRLWTDYYETYYRAYTQVINSYRPLDYMKLMLINKKYWNVALLTLVLSENESIQDFIEKEINITKINGITINYSLSNYTSSNNEFNKAFFDRINPEHVSVKKYTVEELRKIVIEDSYLKDENGDRIRLGDMLVPVTNGLTDEEVFRNFVQAYIPTKGRFITDIELEFNDGITTAELSEGEKKLILIKTILEIVANEKTLLLFDEPDAHLHEGRKRTLYNLMSEYTNRQIVLATHSPTFIEIAEQEQIVLIKNAGDGTALIYSAEKIEAIRVLTGSRFNAFLEKPVLFCESSSGGVETILYPILFPDYKVIPCGGHDEVIKNVSAYNKMFADDTHMAIGIIDWDYMDEVHVEALKRKKIYTINALEIENILMDIYVLNVAKEQFCAEDDCVEKVQEAVIDACKRQKEAQAKKYTVNRIVSKIKSRISCEGNTLEQFKTNISSLCSVDAIDLLYRERVSELDDIISNSKFDELVRIYDFNHNIDYLAKFITIKYRDRVLKLIRKNEDLQETIKEKYYSAIP